MTLQQVFGPNTPAQPSLPDYAFSALNLFTDFSAGNLNTDAGTQAKQIRLAFKAASGQDAPNWDPTRPAKYWADPTADTSDPGNVSLYKVGNPGQGTFVQLVLPSAQAASVNIPGLVPLPGYIIAPTAAINASAGNPGQPVNPTYLASMSDALALAAEWFPTLSATQLKGTVGDNSPEGMLWNGETRRFLYVLYNGQQLPVGISVAQQNAHGLNPDGTWSTNGSWSFLGGTPTWVSGPSLPDGINGGQPSGIAVPVPVRPLLPNEKVAEVSLAWMVQRTDIVVPSPSGSGGGLTTLEHDLLVYVAQGIAKGVPGAGPVPTI